MVDTSKMTAKDMYAALEAWKTRSSYKAFFKEYLKIRDRETSEIIPFETNSSQDKLIDIIEQWEKEYPDPGTRPTIFIIILKARRRGFSTATEGVIFKRLMYEESKVGMIVSYDADSATNISDMSNLFYQHLPQEMKPERRPSQSKGILFENPGFDATKPTSELNDPGLQSRFLIETSRNLAAGSSFNIHYLHLSEVAKWQGDIKVTMTSLLQAVPGYGGIVVVESTALGYNYFFELWNRAINKENNYIPLFVPWFEDEGYVLSCPGGFTLTDEEQEMKDLYNLSNEQLRWRRWCIANKCSGDPEQFKQEYPACWEEAFLSSGRPAFNVVNVQKRLVILREQYKKKPFDVGNIERKDGKYKFVPDKNGILKVYKHPEKSYPYVCGVDTSEGTSAGDWSVGQVLNNVSGEQVAVLRTKCEPDLLAKELYKLGLYYNECLLTVESNNHGLSCIKELQRLGYRYQYKRELYDQISGKRLQKYGFLTNMATRPKMIDTLRAIVRESPELLNDITTLEELITFVFDASGKPQAESGAHDDCVTSLSIAYEARQSRQQRTSVPVERKVRNLLLEQQMHWSVIYDMERNPQYKRYLEKKYSEKGGYVE